MSEATRAAGFAARLADLHAAATVARRAWSASGYSTIAGYQAASRDLDEAEDRLDVFLRNRAEAILALVEAAVAIRDEEVNAIDRGQGVPDGLWPLEAALEALNRD